MKWHTGYIDNRSFIDFSVSLFHSTLVNNGVKRFSCSAIAWIWSVWNSMRFLLISYASQLCSRSNWWSFIGINQRIREYFVEYSWNLSKIALIKKKKNYIHVCSFEFLCSNIIIYFGFILLCDKNRRKKRGNLFLIILITSFLFVFSFIFSYYHKSKRIFFHYYTSCISSLPRLFFIFLF